MIEEFGESNLPTREQEYRGKQTIKEINRSIRIKRQREAEIEAHEKEKKRKADEFEMIVHRSEEQKKEDWIQLLRQYDLLYYRFQKAAASVDQYDLMEKMGDIYKYTKYVLKLDPTKRLCPQGELNGIMFVGINPSIHSKLGDIWNDPYGIYFGKMLEEAGIDKSEVWVTNLYKKPTPDNRPLTDREIAIGKKELELEFGFVCPQVLVPLGKQVCRVFGVEPYGHRLYKGCQIFGMQHPSYIQRNPRGEVKDLYINQLKKINKAWKK